MNLKKLVFFSKYKAFKYNVEPVTGSYTISGSMTGGLNIRTFQIPLTRMPDMQEILYNTFEDYWFNVPNGGIADPTMIRTDKSDGGIAYWFPVASLNGLTVTVTLYSIQTYVGSPTITPLVLNYSLIDYSVF